MTAENKTAIVVGAGFGGIATALRLRAVGFDVTVIDRCERAGGRAQVFERGGYRHDAGPTVITAPFLFDELFELFGEKREDHVEFAPLDPWYRYYFSDTGEGFDYKASVEDTCKEIAKFSPEDQQGYKNLLKLSEKIFNVGFTKLAHVPFNNFFKMLSLVPALLKLQSYKSVYQLVSSFLKHDKMRQAFTIHPLLVGGNPFDTTSIYALIHYLEREWGVHFAMGGTGALVDAHTDLMARQGIKMRLGETVRDFRINNEHTRSDGVILDSGESVDADLVVFNGDASYAYQNLLPKGLSRQLIRRPRVAEKWSMGLYVLYFGTDKQYPDVAHHTIWMGPRYKGLLKDIFDKKVLSDDFSLYLHRPTATDPSFAPEGHDSFYVLCPVPNLQGGQDWSVEGPKLQERIIEALDKTIMPGLKDCVQEPFWMSPADFETDYLSQHGAGFSIAPVLTQSAYFRYHNRDPQVGNLYFTGAGTHPGAGLPGVVSSAKVVEALVKEDFGLE